MLPVSECRLCWTAGRTPPPQNVYQRAPMHVHCNHALHLKNKCVYVHIYVVVCVRERQSVWNFVCTCVCMLLCVSVFVFSCVCMRVSSKYSTWKIRIAICTCIYTGTHPFMYVYIQIHECVCKSTIGRYGVKISGCSPESTTIVRVLSRVDRMLSRVDKNVRVAAVQNTKLTKYASTRNLLKLSWYKLQLSLPFMRGNKNVCISVHIYVHIMIYTYEYMYYICTHTRTHTYLHMYFCMYAHMNEDCFYYYS